MNEGRHIWIIDDDDSIRFVLQRALENASMQVTCFNSANNVLDKLEDVEPDAIITDIRMPGMDGLELLSRLSDQHPSLPVIIMTAHTDLDSAVSAYQGGAFEYLPKPFDIDDAVAQQLAVLAVMQLQRGDDMIEEEPRIIAQSRIVLLGVAA